MVLVDGFDFLFLLRVCLCSHDILAESLCMWHRLAVASAELEGFPSDSD